MAWLIYTHVYYAPPPPDKELEMTPQGPSQQQTGIFDQGAIAMPGELSYIYENNIFLSSRGKVEDAEVAKTTPYKGSFELTGLFKIGDVSGAIINSAASRRKKSLPSKFYRVNESIGTTGYKLATISSKNATATLNNGRDTILLTLDKNDKGSLRRRQNAVKTQAAIARKQGLSMTPPKATPPPKKTSTKKKPTTRKSTSKRSSVEISEMRKKILERIQKKKEKSK